MNKRERFEAWAKWADKAPEPRSTQDAFNAGADSNQPEIEALMRMQEEWIKKWLAVVEENDSLKTENERQQADAERYRLARQNNLKYPFAIFNKDMEIVCDEECDRLIDIYLEDFSTTTKEEKRGSEET